MVIVPHSESIAICGEAIDRSGEVGAPCEGTRVGESPLSSARPASVMALLMSAPLSSARVEEELEYQERWWALKSPRKRESSRVRRNSNAGEKPGGQEVVGGMYILMELPLMVAVMARCSVAAS